MLLQRKLRCVSQKRPFKSVLQVNINIHWDTMLFPLYLPEVLPWLP